MSGEFRELFGSGFAWTALRDMAEANPGRHEISRALQPIYLVLSQIEAGCAWYEASDSGPDAPVMALVEHGNALKSAVEDLLHIRGNYQAVIEAALRKAKAE